MPRRSDPSSKSSKSSPAKPTSFGELLQKHRLNAGYSQEYLAERARVSSETIGALERGARRAPHADTLRLLLAALELSGAQRHALENAAARARLRPAIAHRGAHERVPNLPAQLTPIVGRDDEMTRLAALVAKDRLVTVTGPIGIGKTRVALEVAARHAQSRTDEVWLVDLAALEPGASVFGKILTVLGAPRISGDLSEDLRAALAARLVLFVFDSCEHVIAEVATAVLTLLQTNPNVRVLVASSERLNLAGETLFRLPPLSIPDHLPASVEEAQTYPALALFIERARSEANIVIGGEHLQKAVEICRRLDGIPRAIEFAAARLAALGLRDLHARIDERFVLSGGGRDLPARKQMPLEALNRSFKRLTAAEQTLLRRLSIFTADHTLEDAEAVCADEDLERARVAEILDSLVHKSLVAVTRSDGITRYRMFKFVRSHALERLAESGERDRFSAKHARQSVGIRDTIDAE